MQGGTRRDGHLHQGGVEAQSRHQRGLGGGTCAAPGDAADQGTAGGSEGHAARAESVEGVEVYAEPPAPGHGGAAEQIAAGLIAREVLAIQQRHAGTAAGQGQRGGGTGRAGTHHYRVPLGHTSMLPRPLAGRSP